MRIILKILSNNYDEFDDIIKSKIIMIIFKLLVYKEINEILKMILENEIIIINLYKDYLYLNKIKNEKYQILLKIFFESLQLSKIINNSKINNLINGYNLNKNLKIFLKKTKKSIKIILDKNSSLYQNKNVIFNLLTSKLTKEEIETNKNILLNNLKYNNSNNLLIEENNKLNLKIKKLKKDKKNNLIDIIIYKKENIILQNKINQLTWEKNKLEELHLDNIKNLIDNSEGKRKSSSFNSTIIKKRRRTSMFLIKNFDIIKTNNDCINFVINIEKNIKDDNINLKKIFFIEVISEDEGFHLIRDINFNFKNNNYEVYKNLNEYENNYNSLQKNTKKIFNFIIKFKSLENIKNIEVECNYKIDKNEIGNTLIENKNFFIPFSIDKLIEFNEINNEYFKNSYVNTKEIYKINFMIPYNENLDLFNLLNEHNKIIKYKENHYLAEFNINKEKIGIEFLIVYHNKLDISIYKENQENLNVYQLLFHQCLTNN